MGKAVFRIAKDELQAIAIADDLKAAGFSHDGGNAAAEMLRREGYHGDLTLSE